MSPVRLQFFLIENSPMFRSSLLLFLASFAPGVALFTLGLIYGEQTYTTLAYISLLLPAMVVLSSIVAAVLTHRDQAAVRRAVADGIYPEVLSCPQCHQETTSLNKFRLPAFLLFVGIAGGGSSETHQACGKCMRRSILVRYFALLIPGNLVTLMFTPFMVSQWLRSHTTGHSAAVFQSLCESSAQRLAETPAADTLQRQEIGDSSQNERFSALNGIAS